MNRHVHPPLTVSVVIPVKDDARRLAVCLAAIRRQTVAPLEVVVVDNGSTDASAAVARAGGARVVREEHAGIPAASAAGYDAAIGDVIARLDADSIPPAEWVETIRGHLTERPDLQGFRTIFVHWPHDLPWLRWARIVSARRGTSRPARLARGYRNFFAGAG